MERIRSRHLSGDIHQNEPLGAVIFFSSNHPMI